MTNEKGTFHETSTGLTYKAPSGALQDAGKTPARIYPLTDLARTDVRDESPVPVQLTQAGLKPEDVGLLYNAYMAISNVVKAQKAYRKDHDLSHLKLAQTVAQTYLSMHDIKIMAHSQSKSKFVQDLVADAEALILCNPRSRRVELASAKYLR